MQVFVKMGQPLGWQAVEVDPYDTVAAIREKLTVKVGLPLPWHKMRVKKFFLGYLKDGVPLVEQGLYHGAQLDLAPIMGGGRGDGGLAGAESRDCDLALHETRKAAKVNPIEESCASWSRSQLSGEQLEPPCLCDVPLTFRNKETKGLVHKSLPQSLDHISNLRHVVDLKLTANSTNFLAANGESYMHTKEQLLQFPVTELGSTGELGFSALCNTGRFVGQESENKHPEVIEGCKGCGSDKEDLMQINGGQEELPALKKHLMYRGPAEEVKKGKKRTVENADQQQTQHESLEPKKVRVTNFAPLLASKDVYASIFSSTRPCVGQAHRCCTAGARGANLPRPDTPACGTWLT
ncbi:unnamed protein product [Ostreobium quekettii]|uniref:Ubiquitin-like domain-containing protein n=1 Tax=Ostreobium quekettii TaxID=121088 RepID=A0A8S1J539_9CHLO|nr:unnamed protein product [Ostreobium quekettii]|eukprot:evm.model.scf_425EXC.8 EVM.evm.TU.scf_425EXC.8   scf_425EXC:43787-48252(-)